MLQARDNGAHTAGGESLPGSTEADQVTEARTSIPARSASDRNMLEIVSNSRLVCKLLRCGTQSVGCLKAERCKPGRPLTRIQQDLGHLHEVLRLGMSYSICLGSLWLMREPVRVRDERVKF